MNYFQKFFDLDTGEKLMFLEALFFIYLAKVMLLILPFRVCIKTLAHEEYESIPKHDKVRSVKLAVERSGRLAFWKNICLVNSFAARWMLNRRKIESTFSIGVKHDEQKNVIAHAWLMVKNFEIVSRGDDYITVTKF